MIAIIICPIAVAYSMAQIVKSVSFCLSVCLSVCADSHGRISLSIFTNIGHRGVNPQKYTRLFGIYHVSQKVFLVCGKDEYLLCWNNE